MSPEIVSEFRKSSYSAQMDNCVELARTSLGGHAVRDSKYPSGPVQFFGAEAWTGFIQSVTTAS
ncbi:DUF397 domain-containing protein [Streptomyces acidiscabies]|uniref:DUF397 domain-containing protein n=1 Tax=Streptomyces acidiscabies TaxID=42234 RepID=A0AAP6EKQ7_9ACTN|nr:DUF397 domain-containing protein [Streptomyces acidiscabies]MBP5940099.1 DUF397 domain-containing protein [Streptomyces sp. LBUM 1476]MBZ3911303.1 DUF397 domain-containing protein [Streptomyces acidiscabies]MDX2966258.1 DUF397 domain-containing protein [Streptomyces acidiscabies]MDX3025666.1 DUF397 domain-containing protein [Streptomyces acidiscabies]MDX3796323.1 DUF397 domain-containing protein [Streptomyces acidiscabies]